MSLDVAALGVFFAILALGALMMLVHPALPEPRAHDD